MRDGRKFTRTYPEWRPFSGALFPTRLRQRGDQSDAIADLVEQASAHWLRHTAGSHMANNDIDLRHVRDNLGHESISTTNYYLHSTDDVRHRETEIGHKITW